MASTINLTRPWIGLPALVRQALASNFSAAKTDIEALQAGTGLAAASVGVSKLNGPEAYGQTSSSTPDANGNVTVAHGLSGTPTWADVGIVADTANRASVQALDGTNITVLIKDAAGADVTTGTFNIMWRAKLAAT